MLPQIIRSLPFKSSLAAVSLAVALPPAAALADSDSVEVHQLLTKTIVVQSNGSHYHQVSAGPLNLQVHIQADAGISGRVKQWEAFVQLVNEDAIFIDLSVAKISKVYPLTERPKTVDRIETIFVITSFWEHQVKGMCNALADELRNQGLGNKAIFAEDRKFPLMVQPRLDVDYSGVETLDQAFGPPQFKPGGPLIEVVCKKWPGAVPQTAGGYAVQEPEVVNLGLNIVEKSTMGGTCRIRLDGWVTTDLKNAKIDVQFENEEGKKSPVQTVDTGVSKTATFSRWEEVANHPQGQVRIVGDGFESDWVNYDLHCVEGGPNTVVSNSPPLVTLSVVPQGEVMVRGYICPQVVKLIGVLQGRGNVSGKAVFFGKGYISPQRDYSITHGQKVLLGAEAELDWDGVVPPEVNTSLAQNREFGLNVTNEKNKVIASVPKRQQTINCRRAELNPAVQAHPGGLATENRDPQQSGATAPRQLRVQPQASPTRRLRLQRPN